MIKSFRNKETEQIFSRRFSRRLPAALHRAAWRKLALLDAAEQLGDLRVAPGNRLETLSGNREGQHSIRINDQWRICFRWYEGDAYDVEITDYHQETAMAKIFPPAHPGEILLEEFLRPMGISQYRLAKDISVPPRRINEIVHGKRAITADTALRLSRYFGLSDRFWLTLQAHYDLEVEKDRLAGRLDAEVKALASHRLVPASS
jgi:addiction module HigA family antidote